MESHEILSRIQFELKDKKYKAVYVTDKSVSFKDNPWRMRWNFEPYMLDEGEFVISNAPLDGNLLTLRYNWNYYPFLLIYAFMVIILIWNKVYDGIWFFGAFYAIVIPIDILRSKVKANEMLATILKTEA